METKKTKFQKQCEEASVETGVDVSFILGCVKEPLRCCEDDGTLHITKNGVHACFDVSLGQNLNGLDQNNKARKVMKVMGLEKHLKSVLVDETEEDEEDDCCPHCGR